MVRKKMKIKATILICMQLLLLCAFASRTNMDDLVIRMLQDEEDATTTDTVTDDTASTTTTTSTANSHFAGTIIECLRKSTYYFCNNNNEPAGEEAPNADQQEGWCCPPDSTATECQHDPESGNQCTEGDYEEIGLPLYATYWVGMTPENCNVTSNELVATSDL